MRSLVLAAVSCLGAAALAAQSWTGVGPPGGEIGFVVVAPSNPTIVYASSRFGGVFRSNDSGMTFDPTVEGLPTEQVQCLAVSPTDSRTIYAGATSGAFKSTDSGNTWAPLGGGFPSGIVNSMLVDPSNASTVYAAGTGGTLVKSTDAGATWTAIGGTTMASTSPRILAIAAGQSSTLFLGTLSGGFFRSTDGGSTWTAKNDGFLALNPQVFAMAADPSNASVVYAAVGSDVYLSTQGGGNWQLYDFSGSFITTIGALAVDAGGTAYAADQLQFYLRASGAGDWSPVLGADKFVNWMAAGPSAAPPLFLAHGRAGSSEGGVDIWQGGTAFSFSFANADAVSFIAADPQQNGRWLAATTGGIVEYEANRARPWLGVGGIAIGIATDIVFDTRTAGVVYVSTASGIFKSADAGLTFASSSNGIPSTIPPVVVRSLLAQPGTATGMLAGTNKGLYQSADGANWALGSGDLSGRQVFGLSSDPHGASTVWAGTDDGVYRSTNAGANFSKAGVSGNVHVVLPSQAGPIYAAADSGLFVSTDGGATWTPVSGVTPPVVALAEDAETGAVFAGSAGGGVFQGSGGGASWRPPATGLLNPNVLSLAAADGTLLAGTNGGSAFSLELAGGNLTCTPNTTTLCFGGARFMVQMEWTKPDNTSGAGNAVSLTDNSGYFWFFDPTNIEAVIKVLNGCAINNAYWVFTAGLTNVEVLTTVTDTKTGIVYTNTNPQGTAFVPVQATNAFPTSCP
ncbi:MAG TPA: hypothetical protein VKG23_18755 [Thermoanaerobaculia bacterium]|nr:hypothetical protein [Thermoanaerobaculia bacterium]